MTNEYQNQQLKSDIPKITTEGNLLSVEDRIEQYPGLANEAREVSPRQVSEPGGGDVRGKEII